MKRFIPAATLAALILTAFVAAGAAHVQKNGEKSKGGNDQVKLYSDAVEVVEVSNKAEKCPTPGEGTSLKLRVKSEKPVDVRIHYTTRKGSWASSDYMNKKSGDEVSTYDCHPKTRYKVQ